MEGRDSIRPVGATLIPAIGFGTSFADAHGHGRGGGPMRIPSWAVPLARWLRDYRLLYFRTVRVYECDVSAVATRKPAIEIEVFEAKEEEIRRLAALVSSAPADWIARQARGSTCLIARAGSTYHGYLWITRGAHLVREVDHSVNVSRDPSGAYIHNVFVMPESRRLGIFGALVEAAKGWAQARGLSRLYTSIARDNDVSERAHRAVGFRTVVGSVTVFRVGRREWKHVSRRQWVPGFDVLS